MNSSTAPEWGSGLSVCVELTSPPPPPPPPPLRPPPAPPPSPVALLAGNFASLRTHSGSDAWHIFRCEEAEDGNHTIRQYSCATATCEPETCKELPLRPEFDEKGVRSTRPIYHGECLSNGAGTNSSWAYACGVPVDHTYLKHKAIADAAWARVRAAEKGLDPDEL